MTTYRDRLNAGTHTADPPDEDLTVDQLKTRLRALDQPVYGTKAELQERLEQAREDAEPGD